MAKTPLHRIAIIVVPIIAAILIVAGLVVYVQGAFAAHGASSIGSLGPLSFGVVPYITGTATYDGAQFIAPYATAKYSTQNANFMSVYFGLFSRNPLPNIYFLNTTNYCYQCYTDAAVSSNVSAWLHKYGDITPTSSFAYIKPDMLSSLPPNSVIIVPSGLLPAYLVPNSQFPLSGTVALDTLLNKSDTIIYVGDNFSRSSGPGGVIFSTSSASLLRITGIGLSTGQFSNNNASKISSYFNSPTYGFVRGSYYGYATYANAFNGTVVALSNTQTSGWRNASAVGIDIAKAIDQRFWLNSLASATQNLNSPTNGTIGVPAFNTSIANNALEVGKLINSSYGIIIAYATNSTDFIQKELPVKVSYIANGTLGMPAYLGQTQSVPLSISINTGSQSPQLVQPHIDLFTRNLSFVESVPVPYFNTTPGTSIIKYYSFAIPSGSYVAYLRGFYNRNYSAALFNVTNVTLTPLSLGFRNGTFSFLVESNNFAVTNTSYLIDLNGAYGVSGNVINGVITYKLPQGTVVGFGPQTFDLYMFNTRYRYATGYSQQVLNIPTIYIEFIIVGLAVLILNLIVKPPNRDEYYIDVPEFQEAKKVNIKINRSEVLNVFDRVNFLYHWKYMPLTLEEIKNGIGNNVRYNNIPVAITMQNAALVMSKLAMDGDVVSSGGYWAPKRWIAESGYDVEYLGVFRRVRDYSVGHAMLFTDIGASDIADTILSKGGVQVHVMIYSSISGIRNVQLDSAIKTYIVFADEEKRLNFMEKLYKSYGNQAEELKMAVSYGYLRLIDADNLDQLVF